MEGPQLCYVSRFGAVLLKRCPLPPLPWPTGACVWAAGATALLQVAVNYLLQPVVDLLWSKKKSN